MKVHLRFSARGIVIAYALAAAAWIAFSDRVATGLAPSQDALATISTMKGWVFVAVTSALLAGLLGASTLNAAAGRASSSCRSRSGNALRRTSGGSNRVLRTLSLGEPGAGPRS